MSVTALDVSIKPDNHNNDELIMFCIEAPVEAIDLVFEELDLDPRTMPSRLDVPTLRPLIGILRRGYRFCDGGLPESLSAMSTMAQVDPTFTVSLGVFIDVLWELRQEMPEDADD